MNWWAAIPGIIQGAGELFGGAGASRQSSLDRQTQHAMMKEGIQWRVADAKAAGIHPLYALGAQGFSYSPSASYAGDYGAGSFAQAGQDIQRARQAALTDRERREEMARAASAAAISRSRDEILFKQQVERNDLENTLLASRIATLNQPGTPPGFPDGAAPVGAVAVNPARTTSPSPDSRGREAGAIRDYGFASTDDGGLAVVPSFDVHERIEDNMIQQFGWAIRNQLAPSMTGLTAPTAREHPLPAGATQWKWSALRQQFLPYDARTQEYIINGRRHRAYGGRRPFG